MTVRGLTFALLPLGLAAILFARPAWADTECASPLQAEAQAATILSLDAHERDALHQFYRDRPNDCVWNDEQIAALRSVIAKVDDHGIEPARYHADMLGVAGGDGGAASKDLFATAMALRYAHDMVMGRVEASGLSVDSDIPKPTIDLPAELSRALGNGNVGAWLAATAPDEPGYARLMQAMHVYRERVKKADWMPLPPGPKLEPGRTDPRVVVLKDKLRSEGDLTDPDPAPLYGPSTKLAVENFQRRHGINPDGRMGRETLTALNLSDQERLTEIVANLERWRHFGHVLPATRIEVNLAGGSARLIEDKHDVLTMRAIVGDPEHPSPMLISDHVAAVVLNPPWVVPVSIIKKEIMPKIEADPNYLEKNNMEWQRNSLVQAPGSRNALGHIKFDFRNPFSVYMHDTPSRNLFVRDDRARSHGCVRLEKPMDLALQLLKDDKRWPRERIEEKIARGATIRIEVTGPPVVFAYWTAFVDEDGTMEFRNDIYGVDARIAATLALDGKSVTPTKSASAESGCSAGPA